MKKNFLFALPAAILLAGSPLAMHAQLTSSNSLSPQQMVQQVLLGAGVTATNVTFNGVSCQIATFTATPSTGLGLTKGILLSTGTALTSDPKGPQGPNTIVTPADSAVTSLGDADLDSIVFPNLSTNAAILEFDFVPLSDSIRFRYVFGSEEYNDFVASPYNDVFAFFLSGGTTAPLAPTNIALLPGTTTPISINNVNNGFSLPNVVSSGPCANCAFYIDNTSGSVNTQFDGLIRVLTAKYKVYCGEQYHIKIAIADVGDGGLDSGVFLEAGSFSSVPPLTVTTGNASSSNAFPDSVMVEDCNENCIYIIRSGSLAQADSFQLQLGGNAVLGADYHQLGNPSFTWPTALVFNPGQDTLQFCQLKAIEDNLVEGLDTLLFRIKRFSLPGQVNCVSNEIIFPIYIQDYTALTIAQEDTSICSTASIVLDAGAQGGYPGYTYQWQPGGATTPTLAVGPLTQSVNYTLTVNDLCQRPVTQSILVASTGAPVLSALSDYTVCMDSLLQVNLVVNGGVPGHTFQCQAPAGMPVATLVPPQSYVMTSATTANGTYTVTVSDQCAAMDTLLLNVHFSDCFLLIPNVVTPNGDGKNDVFRIQGLENYPNSLLTIYNRWGNKLYDTSDYKNNWTADVNSGTYYYVLQIPDGRTFNGFFQVFKD